MDSLEVNKVIAAVLVAGIAFFVTGTIADHLIVQPELKKSVIKIEGVPAEASSGTPKAAGLPPLAPLLAKADVKKGEDFAKKVCAACHTFNKGGQAEVGPNLYGIVGDPHAHMQGFAYSDALKSKKGPWTYAELNEWLHKPSSYAPGTRMPFAGIPDAQTRADVIAYLKSISPAAPPYPKPEPAKPAAAPATAANAPKSGLPPIAPLLAKADVKAGQDFADKVCAACHTFNKGGAAGVGPNLYGIVGDPHAHMKGYDYSSALKSKQGPWTYEELNEWLHKPSSYAPGTKMPFAGIPQAQMRANVIAYLKSISPEAPALPKPEAASSGAPASTAPAAASATASGAGTQSAPKPPPAAATPNK